VVLVRHQTGPRAAMAIVLGPPVIGRKRIVPLAAMATAPVLQPATARPAPKAEQFATPLCRLVRPVPVRADLVVTAARPPPRRPRRPNSPRPAALRRPARVNVLVLVTTMIAAAEARRALMARPSPAPAGSLSVVKVVSPSRPWLVMRIPPSGCAP